VQLVDRLGERNDVVDEQAQVNRLRVDGQLAGFDARNIEKLSQQASEFVTLTVDLVQRTHHAFGIDLSRLFDSAQRKLSLGIQPRVATTTAASPDSRPASRNPLTASSRTWSRS
jgi:hypothetical protein